jgi:hypothetical protein
VIEGEFVRLEFWKATLWLTLALFVGACATLSGGHIPPSAFEFHNIVPQEGAEPSGWRVAQVNILLFRASRRKPLRAWCDIEVGVPIVSGKRPIPDFTAQERSAEAADEASRVVLTGNETVSALACQEFREGMRRLLKNSIEGVRVTKFMTPGVEPKSFPDD